MMAGTEGSDMAGAYPKAHRRHVSPNQVSVGLQRSVSPTPRAAEYPGA